MRWANEYLEGLPEGLDSYPEAECKASVLNVFAQPHRDLLLGALKNDAIRNHVALPPPSSAWLPEVHVQFIFQTIRELLFPKDEDFIDHSRRVNQQLLSSPLYSILFHSMSHARVARLASSAWARFHRGSSLSVLESSRNSHVARMDFPPRLLTPISVQGIVTGIEYALYLGGARDISLEVLESDLDHHTFRITWARRGA